MADGSKGKDGGGGCEMDHLHAFVNHQIKASFRLIRTWKESPPLEVAVQSDMHSKFGY